MRVSISAFARALRHCYGALALALVVACAPASRSGVDQSACPAADLQNDAQNCGACDRVCPTNELCNAGQCASIACTPGATADCYSGPPGTLGIGACHGGQKTCAPNGFWGEGAGAITPRTEICGNLADDNCNGAVDENEDTDGDGFTTCDGDCCDNTGQCGQPERVNPGAFDAPGNSIDDDCDGQVDNGATAACDTGLESDSTSPMDYARAMELCQTATTMDRRWGVISAKWTLADGNGTPVRDSYSIRPAFGANVTPRAGASMFEISTGNAADQDDMNPGFYPFHGLGTGTHSGYPADWLSNNGGVLPNAPGCPGAHFNEDAQDPVMLTLRIRVPTNAQSFSFSTNFYSAEYPEWVCTPYNDFFVVLLKSTWSGTPANPTDGNLATYTAPNGMRFPVGVNLATGNTGLFNQCLNATTGCAQPDAPRGMNTTCQSTSELTGTGFDVPTFDTCNSPMIEGGGTGWLVTKGNVKGGEIITLRIAIWDTSDEGYDSLAIIDNFKWAVTAAEPGTNIP